jgi:hypothetical protein
MFINACRVRGTRGGVAWRRRAASRVAAEFHRGLSGLAMPGNGPVSGFARKPALDRENRVDVEPRLYDLNPARVVLAMDNVV